MDLKDALALIDRSSGRSPGMPVSGTATSGTATSGTPTPQTIDRLCREPREPLHAHLVCGFTPLHLATFIHAELIQRHPDRSLEFHTGLFEDVLGSLQRVTSAAVVPELVFVALEWPDLDPRLGLRQLGSWSPGVLDDVLATVGARLDDLAVAIAGVAEHVPVTLAMPTLAMVPISHAATWQDDSFQLAGRAAVLSFAARLCRDHDVRCVSAAALDRRSPPDGRRDVAMDLRAGFPYRRPHASALARALVATGCPRPRKKGLITDLDDTLWRGVLGEVGADGVTWDLDHNSQSHGLYQRFLAALGESGVLLAVASKNDQSLVATALARPDALVSARTFYPICAHWGPKSRSVADILAAWNIASDSVVMVDDSAMELAEIAAAHPDVECLRFPARDPGGVYQLIETLRDRFGTDSILAEDAYRADSLRNAAALLREVERTGGVSEDFLRRMDAVVTVDDRGDPGDRRPFELVNKTNQWNLNGRRYSEASWREYLEHPDTRLWVVSYRDKFGPLGKIAVLGFRVGARELTVEVWVMSCRAFARRIEHRAIEQLLLRYEVDAIRFDLVPTERNGPLREFFTELLGDAPGSLPDGCVVARERCLSRLPPLYSAIEEA